MEPKVTTVGQLLINDSLPAEFRDYTRVWEKSSLRKFLTDAATKMDPDAYREMVHRLSLIGLKTARQSSESSFTLESLKPPKVKREMSEGLRKEVRGIIREIKNPEQRDAAIVDAALKYQDKFADRIYDEALKAENPFAMQVLAGARGNKSQLSSMIGSDLLYSDNKKRAVPIPVLNSYAEGVDPVEYWAGSYGARSGSIDVKLAVGEAGYFAKRLTAAAHRLAVTDEDIEDGQGMMVDVDDADNMGAVLARDYGSYKKGSYIDGSTLKGLKQGGINRVMIYSPIAAVSALGGLPRLAAGVREHGKLAEVGMNVGITAAQAIAEPVSQGMLNSKHSGGVAKGKKGRTVTGFAYLNQLVEVPKTFTDGAPVSKADGIVGKVENAPQGGNYVYVNDERYYVPADQTVSVKPGQSLEAGDALSDGIVNPKDLAELKGIGEARRRFVQQFKSALQENNLPVHRRNVEVVARGLINQVEITDPDAVPGVYPEDIVSYDYVASRYEPREGHVIGKPDKFMNHYLEKPVLHYSIGTRITPSVVKDLNEAGFNEVVTHKNPPPFKPTMTRAMMSLVGDRDWMVQLGGFNLKKTFLDNVQRGSSSNIHGTSWIPALATGEISKGPSGTY
jgi:DNA-directed RNA polymerase subunit beta'